MISQIKAKRLQANNLTVRLLLACVVSLLLLYNVIKKLKTENKAERLQGNFVLFYFC